LTVAFFNSKKDLKEEGSLKEKAFMVNQWKKKKEREWLYKGE